MNARTLLIMFTTVLGYAAIAPAQEPVRSLQDLIGARGGDGEYQLTQRGYSHVRTEKSGGETYSYWQETENGQCITVRTSNGRYASIVYTDAFDCRRGNSGGPASTRPHQGSVSNLQDLVGVRASYAWDQMVERGYTQVGTQNDMDSQYSFWRQDRTGRCVSVRTSDGRFQDIGYTSDSDCSGSQGYGHDSGRYGSESYGAGGYPESGGVTLYRDLNFGGASENFTSDVPDLRGSRIGNDEATSVRVARGCTAQLYTDIDYRGASVDLSADESDLRRSRIGNDNISSIRVRCGGGYGGGDEWGDSNASYGVTLYRDVNFGGASQTFTSDSSDLRSSRIGNDQTTSVRVSPGCRARLYQDINFSGAYTEIDGDNSDLRGSTVGNDSVTSIRVRCDR